MNFIRKLKPPEWNIEHKLGILCFPILLITFLIGGVKLMFGFIALLEFLVLLIQINMYFRTKNTGFLWMALAFLLITIFAGEISIIGINSPKEDYLPFIIAVIIACVIIIYVVFSKITKWRTREILELAAMPVNDTQNGFSERPLSLGKIEPNDFHIKTFAEFMQKNLIALPYFEEEKVVFSLCSSYVKQIGLERGFDDESWVSFDKSGNVAVLITKNDYLKYKDVFSFDQLCASLGQLFIEFFELHKNGNAVRIIDKFNSLKLNPFIE